MVYHPTARVLTVLELLQSYGRLTGAELARRLEVDIRTVRAILTENEAYTCSHCRERCLPKHQA